MRLSILYETQFTPAVRYLGTAHKDSNCILWWYDAAAGFESAKTRMVFDPTEDRPRIIRHTDLWPPGYEPRYRGRYDIETGEITVWTRGGDRKVPRPLIRTLTRQFPRGHII